jgi:hypothetical protein
MRAAARATEVPELFVAGVAEVAEGLEVTEVLA